MCGNDEWGLTGSREGFHAPDRRTRAARLASDGLVGCRRATGMTRWFAVAMTLTFQRGKAALSKSLTRYEPSIGPVHVRGCLEYYSTESTAPPPETFYAHVDVMQTTPALLSILRPYSPDASSIPQIFFLASGPSRLYLAATKTQLPANIVTPQKICRCRYWPFS